MAGAVSAAVSAISGEMPTLKVLRLGDAYTAGEGENFAVVELGSTEFGDTSLNTSEVLSEDIVVTCWNSRSMAAAEDCSEAVERALFSSDLRITPVSRRETAEAARDGGWRGIESSYRIWAA